MRRDAMNTWQVDTVAAQRRPVDGLVGVDVAPVIHPTAAFAAPTAAAFAELAVRPRADDFYTRYGNPNHAETAAVIAALEGGETALLYASGMAAITATIVAFGAGSRVVAQRELYGGTVGFLEKIAPRLGIDVDFVHHADLAGFDQALRTPAALVLLETPTNPLLRVTDVAAVSALAQRAGAVVAVDATLASPINQQLLRLGADIVLHSATKYLGGHGDLTAGVSVTSNALAERLWSDAYLFGATLSAHDAWMLQRGLRTLPMRIRQHNRSAAAVAAYLTEHPAVVRVHHPSLAGHPQAELIARQMSGPGGVLSFEVRGGLEAAELVTSRLHLAARAASFGGPTPAVVLPASMWSGMASAAMQDLVPAGLIRLAVGLEDPADLIADLDQALPAQGQPQ
ncbi:trans-sulfuration enzyme family protein [Dactylosporangium sp. NPDC000521]|uniref:trans-sulfuration enzyme family protein n=1 Tax=Dactylosporangium sp. NPDC000521 TaxID=3363975 RepID=UPI0036BF0EE5